MVFQSPNPSPKALILQQANSSLKASVYCIKQEGILVVVKDYSHANALLRFSVCKILLHREVTALRHLQGITGVPKFEGLHGQHGFKMEFISGHHPSIKKEPYYSDICLQLKQYIKNLHQRGVTHNDLHPKNFIVDTKGKLFIIDYASAHIKYERSNFIARFLHKQLKVMDRAKVIRTIQRSGGDRVLSAEEQSIVRRARCWHILTVFWKSYIRPFLPRLQR